MFLHGLITSLVTLLSEFSIAANAATCKLSQCSQNVDQYEAAHGT